MMGSCLFQVKNIIVSLFSLNQITSSCAASSYKYTAEFMLETQPQRIFRITSVQSQV